VRDDFIVSGFSAPALSAAPGLGDGLLVDGLLVEGLVDGLVDGALVEGLLDGPLAPGLDGSAFGVCCGEVVWATAVVASSAPTTDSANTLFHVLMCPSFRFVMVVSLVQKCGRLTG